MARLLDCLLVAALRVGGCVATRAACAVCGDIVCIVSSDHSRDDDVWWWCLMSGCLWPVMRLCEGVIMMGVWILWVGD